jgi:hypothetical protein
LVTGICRHHLRFFDGVEYLALNKVHHVEGSLVHVDIGTQRKGARNRNRRLSNSADQSMLTGHVVGGGQHVPEWRSTKHEDTTIGCSDPEGQVGMSTRNCRKDERRNASVDVIDEPLGDTLLIDPSHTVTVAQISLSEAEPETRSQPGRAAPMTLPFILPKLTVDPVNGA